MFRRFRSAGLKLGPRKCKFAKSEVVFLGHFISKEGIRPPSDRVQAIYDFPPPRDAKSLRRFLGIRFLGMIGWFRKSIPNFSATADPLYYLLKNKVTFHWTDVHKTAFNDLKDSLVKSPVLAFPRFDMQFRLAVDTCSKGIGYVLYQFHSADNSPDSLRVVRFGSKALSKWQRSYGPTKLELLGMTTAIMDCASYLRGNAFVVECDHQALRPLFQKKLKGAIYERWMTILQQFNFQIEYKSASQMVVADALSRGTAEDAIPMVDSPDDEDPFFPSVPEATGHITLPDGQPLASLLCPSVSDSEIDKPSVHVLPVVNRITLQDRQTHLLSDVDMGYDADTDDWDKPVYNPIRRRLTKTISASAPKLSPNDKYIPTVASHSSGNSQLGVVSQPPNVTTTLQQDDKTGTMNTNISSANEETVIEDRDRYAVSTDIDSDTHLDPVNVTTEVDSTHDLLSATQQSDTVLSEHAQDSILDSQNGQAQGSVSDTPDEAVSEEPQDSGIDDLTRRTGHIMAQLNMSTQQVKDFQHLDSDLQSILSYIQDGSLPDSQKEARTILLEAGDYLLLDGLLLHSRIRKSRRAKLMNPCQIVLPKCLYQTVLKIYHESSLGSHGGINDTLDKVREYYFFNHCGLCEVM